MLRPQSLPPSVCNILRMTFDLPEKAEGQRSYAGIIAQKEGETGDEASPIHYLESVWPAKYTISVTSDDICHLKCVKDVFAEVM